jgi:sugar lactone lactonase YvrE
LHLPETPRWHDGALWISDMWDHVVVRFDAHGARTDVVRFDDAEDPGGLGWMPDGSLLVVGMEGRCVHRIESDGRRSVHADLSALAPWQCNDMIVRRDGTAYVSHFGYDMWGGTTGFLPASLLRVTPDGVVDVIVDDLLAPNGMALPDDETTLYLSECGRSNVLAFDIGDDGTLSNRLVHASLPLAPGVPFAPPDGICLDEAGAVWAAEPLGQRVLRLDADGIVTDEIAFDQSPLAVALGGDDRRTLYVCSSAEHDKPSRSGTPTGRIDALRVDVPGAGRP